MYLYYNLKQIYKLMPVDILYKNLEHIKDILLSLAHLYLVGLGA